MSRPSGRWLHRLKLDWYLILIFSMVALATAAPARGEAAVALGWITKILIGAVFFLHGARLSREAIMRGVAHWRLHLVVLAATFGLFPLLTLGLAALPEALTPSILAPGLMFLGCLPSTIQSSVAFTAVARGHVAAAIAAASLSNLLGVFLSPLLFGLTLHAQGQGQGLSLASIWAIVLQLLAPFLAGQLARPWIGAWVATHNKRLSQLDRGSILLVVYTAFSAAVTGGVWRQLGPADLIKLLVLSILLLGVVLAATWSIGRALKFDREDQIAILFCGSKKSLASGVPMASALFPGPAAGLAILPLMIFHQIQLMACSAIAQSYAKQQDKDAEPS